MRIEINLYDVENPDASVDTVLQVLFDDVIAYEDPKFGGDEWPSIELACKKVFEILGHTVKINDDVYRGWIDEEEEYMMRVDSDDLAGHKG